MIDAKSGTVTGSRLALDWLRYVQAPKEQPRFVREWIAYFKEALCTPNEIGAGIIKRLNIKNPGEEFIEKLNKTGFKFTVFQEQTSYHGHDLSEGYGNTYNFNPFLFPVPGLHYTDGDAEPITLAQFADQYLCAGLRAIQEAESPVFHVTPYNSFTKVILGPEDAAWADELAWRDRICKKILLRALTGISSVTDDGKCDPLNEAKNFAKKLEQCFGDFEKCLKRMTDLEMKKIQSFRINNCGGLAEMSYIDLQHRFALLNFIDTCSNNRNCEIGEEPILTGRVFAKLDARLIKTIKSIGPALYAPRGIYDATKLQLPEFSGQNQGKLQFIYSKFRKLRIPPREKRPDLSAAMMKNGYWPEDFVWDSRTKKPQPKPENAAPSIAP